MKKIKSYNINKVIGDKLAQDENPKDLYYVKARKYR